MAPGKPIQEGEGAASASRELFRCRSAGEVMKDYVLNAFAANVSFNKLNMANKNTKTWPYIFPSHRKLSEALSSNVIVVL